MSIDRSFSRRGFRASCLGLALAAMALQVSPLALGHSDPRMFGQVNPGKQAPTQAVEIRLPPNVNDRDGLIGLASAGRGDHGDQIRSYGVVVPNASAVVDVNTGVSGQVAEVFARPGDQLRKGEALLSVFNPEFITTQKGYLEFLRNKEKLEVLREEGRLPNYLKDAKENLRWWGMNDRQIDDLIERGKVVEHIVLHAPTDGFVTDLFVQPGALVNAGDRTMKQFVVVGKAVARMVSESAPYWVEGYIYPDQLARLRPGMPVSIRLPNGSKLERPITQIMPLVDGITQRARFLVDLGRRLPGLAAGQNVELSIRIGAGSASNPGGGTWAPRNAVLSRDANPVVYSQIGPGRYLRKPVRVKAEAGEWLRVEGVRDGEKLVVAGKMMLEGLYRISAGSGASTGAGGHDHGDDHHH
jgi:Cu(I)/Ag(I) efflux system membrane fusion protein